MTNHEKNVPPERDKVGYGHPPKHTRWQKGKSGNPKGRPKRVPVDLVDVLDAPVTVTTNGKQRTMSTFEASFRLLAQKAHKGELRAIIKFIHLCEQYGLITAAPGESGGGVVHAPKGVTCEEWIKSEMERNLPDEG